MLKNNKIIQYGLYLTAFLPLLFTPFTFFPWHFGKTVFFQILIEVLLLVFLLVKRRNLSANSTRGSLRCLFKSLNCLDWLILFFLLVISVTEFFGVNTANSFWGNQARANGVFAWCHFGAYYFLLKSCFRREKNFSQNFIFLNVLVAVLTSLTSFFPQVLPIAWKSAAGGGIIGNRAFLANYLVLAIGLSVYCFSLFKKKWCWLFVLSSFLLFYALFLTGTRGAFLGLLVGIFCGLVSLVFVAQKKRSKMTLAITVLVVVFGFSMLVFLNQNGKLSYFSRLSSLLNYSFSSGTGDTRLMAWNIAWQGIKDRPISGWGWGNYEVVFDKFYNPNFLKYSFVETVWDKPHNWLLEIGVSGGLLAVLAYLAVLISAGYHFLRNKNFVLFATLAGGFVANLFLFETTNALLLWFMLLALVSFAVEWHSPEMRFENVNNRGIKNKLLMLAVVLCLVYFLFNNFRLLQYSYFMRQAELSTTLTEWVGWSERALGAPTPFKWENAIFLAQQFVDFDKAGAITDKNKEVKDLALSVVATLDEAGRQYPWSLAYPVWSGQVKMVLGEKFDKKYYIDAEGTLNRAVAISPRKQEAHFLLGRLYLLQQDYSLALKEQRSAVEIEPDIAASHWFYGLTLVASGDTMGGLKEIEKATELGYGTTAEQKLYVLDLYALEKDYPKLIQEYKKLIDKEPENLNWYIKLATVYAVSGDKKKALETAEWILSQAPQIKNEVENFIKEYKLK